MAQKWVLEEEELQVTNEGMRDAYWEASDLLRKKEGILGGEGMREEELDGARTVVRAMFDAFEQGLERLPGEGAEGVRCMDVWVARFRRGG